jgi:outer membrane protein assembly factor BamB
MHRFLAACSFPLVLALALRADDWPQFLGPRRDDTSPEVVSPWKGDLKPLWKQAVGEGHSSPVVAEGVVYLFAQPKGANVDRLSAYHARTGELKWKSEYDRPEFKPLFGNGPRSTPVVADGNIYTLGGTGILACWKADTGDVVWKVDTLTEFKAKNLFFGVSTSPIIVDRDKVVVMVGGKGAGIVAFSTKDGKPVWKATDDPASYSSPIFDHDQLVFLTGAHLLALSTKGEQLWSVPFKDSLNESSTTPIAVGDLVIASSVTAGTIAVRVNGKDGSSKPEKVWEKKDLTCYFSTPVVVGDHIYMVNGAATLTNPSITLRCVEARTGKVAWEKKNVGKYHAAILRCGPAGQERLLMLEDSGTLTLFQPDPKEFKELARSKVCGATWAHPALVNHHLYVRDNDELLCLPLAGGQSDK